MRVAVLAILSAAACTPLPPFQTLETARPLKSGQMLVAGGAMGGAGEAPGPDSSSALCCGGGVGRVRVGIDGTQEIGIDGYYSSEGIGGGKVAYKAAVGEHVAITGGVGGGAGGSSNNTSVGADVGVIGSTDETALFGGWQRGRLYAAARLIGATPVHGKYHGGGITGALALPVGLQIEHGPWVFAGEVGGLFVVERNDTYMNGMLGTYHGGGVYSIVSAGFVFGK